MKAWVCILLAVAGAAAADTADEAAIRKAVVNFNDLKQRPAVLAPDADLPAPDRFAGGLQQHKRIGFDPGGKIRLIGQINGIGFGGLGNSQTVQDYQYYWLWTHNLILNYEFRN